MPIRHHNMNKICRQSINPIKQSSVKHFYQVQVLIRSQSYQWLADFLSLIITQLNYNPPGRRRRSTTGQLDVGLNLTTKQTTCQTFVTETFASRPPTELLMKHNVEGVWTVYKARQRWRITSHNITGCSSVDTLANNLFFFSPWLSVCISSCSQSSCLPWPKHSS